MTIETLLIYLFCIFVIDIGGGRDLATAVGFSKQKQPGGSAKGTSTSTSVSNATQISVRPQISTKSATATNSSTVTQNSNASGAAYDPIKSISQPGNIKYFIYNNLSTIFI